MSRHIRILPIHTHTHTHTHRALFPAGERVTSVHDLCEELVVRKELSDNFCHFNDHYDSFEGAHK